MPPGVAAATAYLAQPAALLALVALAWLALAATAGLRRGSLGDRFADGTLVLCWLAVAGFYSLAPWGGFRMLPALVVLGGPAALLAARRRRRQQPAAAATLRPPTDRAVLAVAIALAIAYGIVLGLRLAKSLAAPPLAWDALTYHLPKAAFWAQSGSWSLPDLPDAWSYYRWYPAGAEILWSWALLPLGGDLLIGPLGLVLWLAILAAGARLARHLGASRPLASVAGLALAALPAVLGFSTSAYSDNAALLMQLLAVTHALAFHRDGRAADAVLAAAAAGLGAAVKTPGLVLALPTLALLVAGWLERRRALPAALPAAVALALALPAAGYARTAIATGSPFFPNAVPFGLVDLPYHAGMRQLLAGELFAAEALAVPPLELFERLFWSHGLGGHVNFGLGGLLVVALAAAASLTSLGNARRRLPLAVFVAGAVLVSFALASPGVLALRTVWIDVLARLLLPAWAPLLLIAVWLPERTAFFGLAASAALSLAHAFPLGFSPSMQRPALAFLAAIAGLAALAWLGRRLGPRARRRAAAAAVLFLVLSIPAAEKLRRETRYAIWAEAARDGGAFDAHPLHGAFADLAPLAAHLDQPTALEIAVTSGWDGIGHNQFLYPLLGSRLQNRLLYVPLLPAGDDAEAPLAQRYAEADRKRWLERVAAVAPDYLVGLWPDTPERGWVSGDPARFELLAAGRHWLARRR